MSSKITLKNSTNTAFSIEHKDGALAKVIGSNDMAQAVDTINDFPTNPHTGQVGFLKVTCFVR